MKKSLALIVTLIIFSNLLTGCWSKRELNELAIASAIGIDKSEDNYIVTVQILNPGQIVEKTAGQRAPVATFRTTGKTLSEALRRLTLEAPRRVYVAHIRAVIIGEELAKEGISDILDFLTRGAEFRTDFHVLVAKHEKAESVLKVLTVLETIPANKIFSTLKTSEKSWASSHPVKLDELINNIVSEGSAPVLTGIILIGNSDVGMNMENIRNTKPTAVLKIDHLAVFKEDKLVGWMNEEESMGYNGIMGNIKSSITTITFPEGGKLSVEITKSESKIKSKMEDGKPKIEIEYRAEGNVIEVQHNIDLNKIESISLIEDSWKKVVEKRTIEVIKKAQQDWDTDIFGFGEVIHRQNPKAWKSLKKNWPKEFKDLPVDIKVETTIKRLGTTINSPSYEEIKE